MIKKTGKISALLLLVALGAVINIGQAVKNDVLKIEPYIFESSKGEKVDAEIGRLTVPENRKAPNYGSRRL